MPVLPVIDLLILLGWTSLLVGFVLKALSIALSYPLSILGLAPIDFLLVAGVLLLFALSLAARTWVRVHEPRLVARRRLAGYGVEQGEGGCRRAPSDDSQHYRSGVRRRRRRQPQVAKPAPRRSPISNRSTGPHGPQARVARPVPPGEVLAGKAILSG